MWLSMSESPKSLPKIYQELPFHLEWNACASAALLGPTWSVVIPSSLRLISVHWLSSHSAPAMWTFSKSTSPELSKDLAVAVVFYLEGYSPSCHSPVPCLVLISQISSSVCPLLISLVKVSCLRHSPLCIFCSALFSSKIINEFSL